MEAAVVSASHGAMGSLLGKLGELLTAKYKLLKEAKGQIMFLKAELETMYVFMKKISDTEEPDDQDKCWAKEVRELSYDIEDSVCEFMLRVERDSSKPRGFKGFINRSMKLLTTMNTRHEIAKEFEGLKIRVKEVSERRMRYKMDDGAPKSLKSLDTIKSLRELTNLTDLEIDCYRENGSITEHEVVERGREVLLICLEKLCNLKYLKLHSFPFDAYLEPLSPIPACFLHLQRFHGGKFPRVPGWICKLHSIYDLNLTVKELLEDDVWMLAQLPSLIHLRLHIFGTPKDKILICGGSGLFPVLKYFEVGCCRISYLSFEAGAMPKLERLELRFNALGWDRYGAPPAGIEHLSGLKEISADIGGSRAKESNQRAAESALRNVADMHPGRPVANIKVKDNMLWAFDGVLAEPWENDEVGGNNSTA